MPSPNRDNNDSTKITRRKTQLKIVASAIIPRSSGVLVVLRPNSDKTYPGKWELPGGTLRLGEKLSVTVKREVKEETGLEIESIRVVSAESYKTRLGKDFTRQTIQITYLARAKSLRKLRLNKEHSKYAWVKQEELGRYPLVPIMKRILRGFFSGTY